MTASNAVSFRHTGERSLTTVVAPAGRAAERIARHLLRFGLVAVIGWIGAMKFTAYEAEGIAGFVENSPLMAWTCEVFSHRQFSAVLGVIEIGIAALVALARVWPRGGVAGAIGAIGMFATTLSFMATTPGVFEPAAGGFPALSAMPGQFLVKDIALLGIAVWALGDALAPVRR